MFKNIVWDLTGKFASQTVRFIISIILTRLLTPLEFGVVGMALAIIIVAGIFVDLGFNQAIIQKKEVTQQQYSSIFFLNTSMALLVTLLCFFCAAPIARFYNQPQIEPVFKWLSLTFLINGLSLVPAAMLYKKLLLKQNGIIIIIASVVSGIVGIAMAFSGYGIWSLVTQSLLNSLLILIMTFVYAGWMPSLTFNFLSLKPLWSYGSRMFASGFLDNVYTRLDTFIIGKIFSASTLGFYTRAQSMDNFIRQFSVTSIMGALFPYIAKHQDDRVALNSLFVRCLHIVCFASIGLSGIFFLTSGYLFTVLFTERWQYAAELFQLISVISFAWPVSSLMCNVIAGTGNSAAFLRLEVYKKILFLPVYIFGFLLGLKGFLVCFIIANFIALFINAVFLHKEISITVPAQLKIILSYFVSGIAAVTVTYFLFQIFKDPGALSSTFILSGCFIFFYLLTSFLLKLHGFYDAVLLLRKGRNFFYDQRYKNIPSSL